jgi:hypothetical protein
MGQDGAEHCTDVQLLMSLPSAQHEQPWIQCSERLPIVENDIKARVLVTTSWGLVKEACYRVDYWDIDDIPYKLTAVVAWMLLPDPYREEKKNE